MILMNIRLPERYSIRNPAPHYHGPVLRQKRDRREIPTGRAGAGCSALKMPQQNAMRAVPPAIPLERRGCRMARVTVEDCVDKVENRFELVLLAAHRARLISQGSAITVDRDNDKNPVVALREIADETMSPGDLKEDLIHSMQKHVEVDEPEAEPEAVEAADLTEDAADDAVSFADNSEEELLAAIQGLVAPEKNDDY